MINSLSRPFPLRIYPFVIAGILLFCVRITQSVITTCEIQTLALARSSLAQPSLYSYLLNGWQIMFGAALGVDRLLSLFLGVLTVALLFRLTADLYSYVHALWVVFLAVVAQVVIILWGSVSIDSWLSMLTLLASLLLWRLVQSRTLSRYWWIVYGLSISALVFSYPLAWVIVAVHLIFLIGTLRSLALKLVSLISLILLIVIAHTTIETSSNIGSLFNLLSPPLWELWLLGLCAVVLRLIDQRKQSDPSSLFLVTWLLVVPMAWFITPFSDQTLASILAIPVLIAGVYAVTLVSSRAQFVLSVVGLVTLLPFSTLSANHDIAIIQRIQNNGADYPVVFDLPTRCSEPSNVLDLLYHNNLPLYVNLGEQWAVVKPSIQAFPAAPILVKTLPEINADQIWRIEELPAFDSVSTSTRPNDKPDDKLQTEWDTKYLLSLRQNFGKIRLSLYDLRPASTVLPTHDVMYRYKALALLKFEVLPDTNTLSGSTLIVRTWWSAPDQSEDNYIVKAELTDQQGINVAGNSGLIAGIFTRSWTTDQTHLDQRVIDIPSNVVAGQYNLVVSVHGSENATNIPVTLTNGSPVGEFGYITTITVQNP